MSYTGFMWECSCGHIEYGEAAPEECPKCQNMESFIKLPEELVAEREKDLASERLPPNIKPEYPIEEPPKSAPTRKIKKKPVKKKTNKKTTKKKSPTKKTSKKKRK